MKRSLGAVSAVLVAMTMPACGTLVGGSSQTIRVNSDPAGALINSNPVTKDYTTPASVRLERKNTYTLRLTKDGYTKEEVLIERGMRGGVLVADILLFPIGVIVDAITGAWYGLSPDDVSVTLVKKSADVEGPESIQVTVKPSKDGIEIDASEPVHASVDLAP